MNKQRSEIAHVDLDAYFVAVEQRDFPELQGKPVIVGGSPESRSVVSSCSYEAREKGIHSGMSMKKAHALLPEAIFRRPRFDEYRKTSVEIMKFFCEYAPGVQQMSIDEAFLDFQNTRYLYDDLLVVLKKLQERLLSQFGLSCSIGLAPSHYFAKLASDFDKPYGFVHIEPDTEKSFVNRLSIENIWGLGKQSLKRLSIYEIRTVQDLKKISPQNLSVILGKSYAQYIGAVLEGEPPHSFTRSSIERSTSVEETFPQDLQTGDAVRAGLLSLAQKLSGRLNADHHISSVIVLKVRFKDFSTFTVQKTIFQQHLHTQKIYETAVGLFKKRWKTFDPIRLMGIAAKRLQNESQLVPDMFETNKDTALRKIDKTALDLKNKYGNVSLRPARTFSLYAKDTKKKNISKKTDS